MSTTGKLAWYEQPANANSAWKEHVIADIIGPMSLDVGVWTEMGISMWLVSIIWRTPLPRLIVLKTPMGRAAESHIVHTGDEHHVGAQLVDIDNDGDLDIVSIGWGHGRVLLCENTKQVGEDSNAPQRLMPDRSGVSLSQSATLNGSVTDDRAWRYAGNPGSKTSGTGTVNLRIQTV